MDVLVEEENWGLVLRGLARRVVVNDTAPYKHYIQAGAVLLMEALSCTEFKEKTQAPAPDGTEDPLAQLIASG